MLLPEVERDAYAALGDANTLISWHPWEWCISSEAWKLHMRKTHLAEALATYRAVPCPMNADALRKTTHAVLRMLNKINP